MSTSLALAARFARRELRGGLKGFRIFLACLTLGVAAIAGVGAVSSSLLNGLRNDARQLLGGDLEVELVHRPMPAEALAWLTARATVAQVAEMRAMARPDDSDRRNLVQLKAVDDVYPVAGQVLLSPPQPLAEALARRDGRWGAVIEPQAGARVGGTLRIGDASFEIRALIERETDRGMSLANFGPRVMIALPALAETGIVQPGSLIDYEYKVATPDAAGLLRDMKARFPDAGWRLRGLDEAAPGLQRFIDQVTQFLTLVGLTALLVGGIGVGNAVRAYLDGKGAVIATLKCLGAPGTLIFQVYLMQMAVLAGGGILMGLALGALAPLGVAAVAAPFLPVPIDFRLDPAALGLAAAFGALTALAFALWPLAKAREVPAASLFRQLIAPPPGLPAWPYLLAIAAALAGLVALAILTASRRDIAIWFVISAAGAVVVFQGAALLLTRAAAALPRLRHPGLRLAVANLHRPGAPTGIIALSLGLGLTVLATVSLIETNMGRQISENLPARAPSYYFIDILPDQVATFDRLVAGVPGVGEVQRTPMVRGRIVKIAGEPAESRAIDPAVTWTIQGDRGFTYSALPPEGARIVAGQWWPADYAGPPLISFDAQIAAGYGIGIGDTLTINVLGREITGTIGNLRQIDWATLGMNFIIVFAPGTLEAAPHQVIATVRADSLAAEERVQQVVTDALPNVSAIRVRDALQAANDVLRAIGIAIRTTASVTLLAGTLVLIGAIVAGQRRRIFDAVVLKVLGATRRTVLGAYLMEYGLLAAVIAAIATAVGSAAAWAVLRFIMRTDFVFDPAAVVSTLLACSVLTVGLGLAGTWHALGQKAAPLLRNE
ncbi:MAG: ABC transporter permease [Thalassobaculales bacterium]